MLLFRAVHNLPWGTLESEEALVEVTEPLGKVSLIINITVMANIINMPHVRNYCFFRGPLSLTSSVALNSRLHLLSPVSRWELWYRKHIAGWQIAWYRGNGPFLQKRYFCCDVVNTWNITLMSRICKCAPNERNEGMLSLAANPPTTAPRDIILYFTACMHTWYLSREPREFSCKFFWPV